MSQPRGQTKSNPKPRTRLKREDLKPGACLCDHCVGKCCRYYSLPIETPTTWDDFDSIRWYLAHGLTIVYVDKGTWHLLVLTKCQYLRDDYRCAIYHDRPKICREYATDECEYDENWIFEQVFERPEQIWEYAEAVLPPRRRKKTVAAVPEVVTIGGLPAHGHIPMGRD